MLVLDTANKKLHVLFRIAQFPMTLKVIHLLLAFANEITIVQYLSQDRTQRRAVPPRQPSPLFWYMRLKIRTPVPGTTSRLMIQVVWRQK